MMLTGHVCTVCLAVFVLGRIPLAKRRTEVTGEWSKGSALDRLGDTAYGVLWKRMD
jgi:hypothetical protein